MIKTALIFVFFSFSLLIYSIEGDFSKNEFNKNVTGKIIAQDNSEKIEGGVVSVYQNGNIVSKTNIDGNGLFKFDNMIDGKYDLKIENIAFETFYKPIEIKNNIIENIGELVVETKVNLLEELIIFVKR